MLDTAEIIEQPAAETIEEMDSVLLDARGLLRLVAADTYRRWERNDLRAWATLRGRYFLPTFEFVQWLKATIGGVYALEVGSGKGDLAHHLGIQGSDSYVQERAEMRAYYGLFGQQTTRPGKHVARADALVAVKRYVPRVVIGAWCTQLFEEGDTERGVGSCMYGIDERKLLASLRPGSRYIAIGNLHVHRHRRLNMLPHELLTPPGLMSRASQPDLDRVWIWTVGAA